MNALAHAIPLALRARSLDIEALHSVLEGILYDDEHPNKAAVTRREIIAWLCDNPALVYYDGARWAVRVGISTIPPTVIAVREWPEDGGVAGDSRRL